MGAVGGIFDQNAVLRQKNCDYVMKEVKKAQRRSIIALFNSNTHQRPIVLFCCAHLHSVNHRGYLKSTNIVQVQLGGSFDIDFDVKEPNQKLLDGVRERQGDYIFVVLESVGVIAMAM